VTGSAESTRAGKVSKRTSCCFVEKGAKQVGDGGDGNRVRTNGAARSEC
jgi:hypothetical protein